MNKIYNKDIIKLTIKYLKALQVLQNDGTYKNYKMLNLDKGYNVATTNNIYKNRLKALNKIVRMDGSCGVWTNEGKVYIDTTKYYINKSYAIKIGKKYNQLSIWDWKKRQCIDIK